MAVAAVVPGCHSKTSTAPSPPAHRVPYGKSFHRAAKCDSVRRVQDTHASQVPGQAPVTRLGGSATLPLLADLLQEVSTESAHSSGAAPEELLAQFAAWAEQSGLPLYPAQEDALLELAAGAHVILATPTGSGKSLVAMGAAFLAQAAGRRTYYTAPIKALVSEKFFDLCDQFGADRVGMVTGDAAVNPDAPIVCATAEILANLALREGAAADVGLVVMDEFHYYGDRERGWAWQVPLIELTGAQFLLMSATLGDTSNIRAGLSRRTGRDASIVAGGDRPVPLSFEYVKTPIHATVELLLSQGRAPIYVVHPAQAAALEHAQALMSMKLCSKEEKRAIADALGGFRFSAGFGRILSRLVRHGIGVHHAGMLPRYRRLVEQLARAGLLKVICGTDTLGVGINVPIRTVLITSLVKYDGRRERVLRAREFHQIAGRAGRPGFDSAGWVVVQAPEHEVENEKQLIKAGNDPKKRRKIARKKPPEGGPTWREDTFERLTTAEPEQLVSQFQVSHAMVLNTAQRAEDTGAVIANLLTENDEDEKSQEALIGQAEEIQESLMAAGVLEALPEPDEDGRTMRLVGDLQDDFALDQPLSTFALAAMDLLDRDSPTYVLDVLSILESTLDDPRPVLRAQQGEALGAAIAEMKADGIEYEERMERVEEISWPKPLEDLLTGAYDIYAQGHPWVTEHQLRPKSVARELSELSMNFVEYVSFHQLAKSEGVVLRYLSNAYKTLRRTVPADARTEEMDDLTEWLGEVVRQVDSSLLDEWEELVNPKDAEAPISREPSGEPPPVTANIRAFRVLVRNAMFRRVQLARLRHWDALAELDSESGWDAGRWEDAMAGYYDEYADVGVGPPARSPALLQIQTHPGYWSVRQVFDDPEGDRDWGIHAEVHLAASDTEGSAHIRVVDVGPLHQGW